MTDDVTGGVTACSRDLTEVKSVPPPRQDGLKKAVRRGDWKAYANMRWGMISKETRRHLAGHCSTHRPQCKIEMMAIFRMAYDYDRSLFMRNPVNRLNR